MPFLYLYLEVNKLHRNLLLSVLRLLSIILICRTNSIAVAHAVLISKSDTRATLTLAWDDRLVIRINNGKPIDMGTQQYVRAKRVEVPLKSGENTISIWLSNEMGLTRGTWVFSFSAVTKEGEVLLPQTF